jgi:hypothetical protein
MKEITTTIAEKVLKTVDCGLSHGLGKQNPGEMCVEAAVCYALDLPHGDDPGCVDSVVRVFKIKLNDSNWSSNTARAKGLRRLALIQLGSKDKLDTEAFRKGLIDLSIRKWLPFALREASRLQKEPHKTNLLEAAKNCELRGDYESVIKAKDAAANAAAVYAAYAAAAYDAAYDAANDAAYAAYVANAAAYAANAYARDEFLSECAEDVVQLLITLKAPGAQWLYLTEDV